MSKADRFQATVAMLRQSVPIAKPLQVRRVAMADCGCTTLSESGRIVITIRRQDAVERQIETLLHEWGHAIEYDQWEPHGPGWASGHARAYTAWEKWGG